jgi:hypothetical protein
VRDRELTHFNRNFYQEFCVSLLPVGFAVDGILSGAQID